MFPLVPIMSFIAILLLKFLIKDHIVYHNCHYFASVYI